MCAIDDRVSEACELENRHDLSIKFDKYDVKHKVD